MKFSTKTKFANGWTFIYPANIAKSKRDAQINWHPEFCWSAFSCTVMQQRGGGITLIWRVGSTD